MPHGHQGFLENPNFSDVLIIILEKSDERFSSCLGNLNQIWNRINECN